MDCSIVIPTFNESNNVRQMVERIQAAMVQAPYTYEIWFIDDSRDDTPQILAQLAAEYPFVHYIHRDHGRGLGTAVVEGFHHGSGHHLIVMDADLQHPPELLPTIVERLAGGIDIVIPSRFVEGGSDGGLNAFRKFVSWTARTIGRISIKRLRDISDCTGGYFGVKRSVIDGAELDPIGWKILMEVLVKGTYQTVHEIPYEFVIRRAGESKMSLSEQWNYLRHVIRLVQQSPDDRRFYMFCFVGALGVVVNLAVMSLFLHFARLHSVEDSIIASLIAMAHNFLWNDRVTWKGYAQPVFWRRAMQFPLFVLVSLVGIGITALSASGAHWIGWPVLLGQLIGIVIATAWGFIANNRWTWGAGKAKQAKVVVTQES